MKLNELRIGNLTDKGIIHWIGYDNGILACGVLENKYSSMAKTIKLSAIKPIPLTEEWLLKMGFRVNAIGYISLDMNDESYLALNPDGFFFAIAETELDDGSYESERAIPLNIQYAHQLQNLYFALTQKELTIK